MRKFTFTLPLVLSCLSTAGFSQTADPVATLAVDFDADGISEVATLRGTEEMTLEIRSGSDGSLLATSGAIGWAGDGGAPTLTLNAAGSLLVRSEHINGPSKIAETITVAYRGGAYVVAGLTIDEWGLAFADPETGEMFGQHCDMNILTGAGVSTYPEARAPQPRRIDFDVPTIAAWGSDMIAQVCRD